ncbi:MAG: alpha/beta hydrolase-fold protein [Pseudomonadota bacterium]
MTPTRRTLLAATPLMALAACSDGATNTEAPVVVAEPPAQPVGAALVNTSQIDLVASGTGRAYRLRIAQPTPPEPDGGRPVLFVLDGDAYFGLATDLCRNLGGLGREIDEPIVAAIGYPDEDPNAWHSKRALDYTPTAPAPDNPMLGFTDPSDYGGLSGFLDMIEQDALPALERVGVVPSKLAVFGHSFGALAVMTALIERPALFGGLIAVSPTVYYNNDAMLDALDTLQARLEATDASPRVHVSVGALESTFDPNTLPPAMHEARKAWMVREAMVEKARRLADTLEGLPGLASDFMVVPDETHVGAPYAALPHALRFVLPPQR